MTRALRQVAKCYGRVLACVEAHGELEALVVSAPAERWQALAAKIKGAEMKEVRKTPSWPRIWADFSLL